MPTFQKVAPESYELCIRTLFSLGRFGIKPGLETINHLLEKTGNPHKQFRSVHIAGTNGKGSTAAFTSSILISSGIKTGLFTSPHLVRFNERISINNVFIPDSEVVELFNRIKKADTHERPATFFEYATAMAFLYFAENNAEIAVIEAGMGGRLDCTNAVFPEVSVITDVSIDHEQYLGNSLSGIASEKAGIIKHGIPVVTSSRNETVLEIIERKASENNSGFYSIDCDFSLVSDGSGRLSYSGISGEIIRDVKIGLKGDHQIDNAALCLAVCGIIGICDKRITPESSRRGLADAKWPGRLEYVSMNPDIILDGAHNPDAAEKLAAYLEKNYGSSRKITFITGMMADKDQTETLRHLVPIAHRIIFTSSDSHRAENPENLKKTAEKISGFNVEIIVISDLKKAVSFCVDNSGQGDVICITGSLYIAGEAKAFFENRRHQTAPN